MSAGDSPDPPNPSEPIDETGEETFVKRLLSADEGALLFAREMLTSALAVVVVGLLLFTVSGVWPPMVAVESGSMEPHMERGDLVFITEPGRYVPTFDFEETGVVPYRTGEQEGYRTFGSYGSVIVYDQPGSVGPPIIHRARFHVEKGENWYDEADKSYVRADNCEELLHCPAPHAGFITKGDANPLYDQASGIASPVKSEWVTGVARVRVPYLGYVRLGFSGATILPVPDGASVRADSPETYVVAERNGSNGDSPSNITPTVSTGKRAPLLG